MPTRKLELFNGNNNGSTVIYAELTKQFLYSVTVKHEKYCFLRKMYLQIHSIPVVYVTFDHSHKTDFRSHSYIINIIKT
jgi:hypothetical protein